MGKIAYLPLSIAAGLAGSMLARKAFDRTWSLIDHDDPPRPDQQDASWAKLIAALAIEGAIMHAVRGAVDHASRAGYQRVSGSWPGKDEEDEQGS